MLNIKNFEDYLPKFSSIIQTVEKLGRMAAREMLLILKLTRLFFQNRLPRMETILGRIVNNAPPMPHPSDPMTPFKHQQQSTTAHLAEYTLLRDLNSCLQMTFCNVGAGTSSFQLNQLIHAKPQVSLTFGIVSL